MKTRLLIIVGLIVMGSFIPQVLGVSENNLEDPVPSCDIGVFVTDDIQCYVSDSPPCSEPSVEKNGLCVVKKIDICDEESVLVDGFCQFNGNFRVDDPTFTRQNLLTGKPILDPNHADFQESGDSIGMIYAYSGLSLVGIIVGFFVVKKWKSRK